MDTVIPLALITLMCSDTGIVPLVSGLVSLDSRRTVSASVGAGTALVPEQVKLLQCLSLTGLGTNWTWRRLSTHHPTKHWANSCQFIILKKHDSFLVSEKIQNIQNKYCIWAMIMIEHII